jgi:NO-binding membrane sensor protein with MHYT domain
LLHRQALATKGADMKFAHLILLAGFTTAISFVQEALDEVVVTGSRAEMDYYGMPAATITSTLLFSARLLADSFCIGPWSYRRPNPAGVH